METKLYDQLVQYSEIMFNRNLKAFYPDNFCPDNFIPESIDSISEAKKIILGNILTEKRRMLAQIQQSDLNEFDIQSKVCRKCGGDEKPISEFSEKTDKRTGFKYYSSCCKKCVLENRRDLYSRSEKIRESNRLRQKRWRDRRKYPINFNLAVEVALESIQLMQPYETA